jgi:branched-chain amino acid transport system permease protein
VVFRFAQDWIAAATPQYWQFWIGLFLVLIVLVGRDRIGGWFAPLRRVADRVSGWRARRRAPPAATTQPAEGGRP